MNPALKEYSEKDFHRLFAEDFSFLDVRSESEYLEGAMPNSINVPILDDHDRDLVGKSYKAQGKEFAIELGKELVNAQKKERIISSWLKELQQNPKLLITCFRGGLRSQFSQQWCLENGIERERIQGGYKALRQFLIQEISRFCQTQNLLVLSGPTGSAKTLMLRRLSEFLPVLDLEKYANHRGSAFGSYLNRQPSQASFENQLAKEMIELQQRFLKPQFFLIEDESRMIGRCVQPDILFEQLRKSPVILLEEPLEKRVGITYQEYILESGLLNNDADLSQKIFNQFKTATKNISKKLGGQRAQVVLQDIELSEQEFLKNKNLESNRVWIEKLLKWYYDPLYLHSFERRQPNIQFRGNEEQVLRYFRNL